MPINLGTGSTEEEPGTEIPPVDNEIILPNAPEVILPPDPNEEPTPTQDGV